MVSAGMYACGPRLDGNREKLKSPLLDGQIKNVLKLKKIFWWYSLW